jgi:hypothetical protein
MSLFDFFQGDKNKPATQKPDAQKGGEQGIWSKVTSLFGGGNKMPPPSKGPGGPGDPVSPIGPVLPGKLPDKPMDKGGPQVDPKIDPKLDPKKAAPAVEEKPIDPKAVRDSANQLFKAMDGWGTDEDAIHNALRGKSPAEVKAIKAAYQDHFGRSLDNDIKGELGGKDLEEAQAALSGDPVKSAVAALDNAANGGMFGMGTDEKKIQSVLENVTDPAQRKQIVAAYEKKTGQSLDKMLKSEMSGNDLALSKALLEGDKAKAAAVKLDEAMNGGFLNLGLGTDENAVYDAIESCKDEKERKALAAAYQKKTGEPLTKALGREFSGAEKDVASNLLKGDKAGAEAARVKVASEDFWGTDEEAIFKSMEGKSPKEREQLIAKYNQQYGNKAGGQNFDQMLKSELSGLDLEKANQLKKDGKISDEFALKYATNGIGTNEELIRKTLEGKSKTEIDELRKTYKEKYGQDLDALLKGEVSGRDGFEIGQMMKGKPETPEEMVARANEAYEFDRGSGSNWFSRGVTDLFSDSGQVLDYQHQRINNLAQQAQKDGSWSGAAKDRLGVLTEYQGQDVQNYQAAKDSATNAVATGAAVVVGAVVSIATAGSASPAVVAALSALLGGASSMAVKGVMLEGGYALEDIGVDAVTTLASALTAGAFKLPGLEGQLNKLVGIADPKTATMLQTMLKGGLSSAGQNGINSLVGGLMNEQNYQGDFGDFVKGMGSQVGSSMLTSFVNGGTSAGVGKAFGNGPNGMNPYMFSAIKGGSSSAAGQTAANVLDPSMFSGRPEDIAKKWVTSVGGAGLSGSLDSIAETRAELKEAKKAQAQTPDQGPDKPKAEQNKGGDAGSEEGAHGDSKKGDKDDVSEVHKEVAAEKQKGKNEKAPEEAVKESKQQADQEKTRHEEAKQDDHPVKPQDVADGKAADPHEKSQDASAQEKGKTDQAKPVGPESGEKAKDTEADAKVKKNAKAGVGEESTLDDKGRPKRKLSADEQALEDLRAQAKTTEDHEMVNQWEQEIAARKKGDEQALRELAAEAEHKKAEGQKKADGSVLGVDEARTLQGFATELGVDPKTMPKASTVEERLRSKGFTPDEIEVLKGTIKKNQQATMPDSVARELEAQTNAGKPATEHRTIGAHSEVDALGQTRGKLTDQELKLLLKMNIALFEDVQAGQKIAKVIGGDTADKFYKEGTPNWTVSGDVGLLQNTEGMNADQRIKNLGLDYVTADPTKNPYVNRESSGLATVNPDGAENLRVLEATLTPEMIQKLQVPMGYDLQQAALAERNAQLTNLRQTFPDAKAAELEAKLPQLLRWNKERKNFQHIQLRGRFESNDPSTGMGMTASQGLRDEHNDPFFQMNQELTFSGRTALGRGGTVSSLDDDGVPTVQSTMEDPDREP